MEHEVNAAQFCRDLAARYPEVEALLAAYLADDLVATREEPFSHIFFDWKFVPWFNSLLRSEAPEVVDLRRSIASHLEAARATKTTGILELLSVTFVEGLPREQADQRIVERTLGPLLRADYVWWLQFMGWYVPDGTEK